MCEELHKDLNSNGTAMQIIKAIATYSAGRWNKLYIDDRRMTVVVPWYELVAFVKRQKIDISSKAVMIRAVSRGLKEKMRVGDEVIRGEFAVNITMNHRQLGYDDAWLLTALEEIS